MTCGTVSAAETGQPQRDPGTSLATSRPTDNGPRSEAQSRRGRRTACPRAEPPYAAVAFVDCSAQHRTDRTPCRPPWSACVLDFADLLAGLPLMPMSGSCAPVYVCICLHYADAGWRSFIQSCLISGTRLPDWACVKVAEMLRFGVPGIGYAGQLSRRIPPRLPRLTGPERLASPRVVT